MESLQDCAGACDNALTMVEVPYNLRASMSAWLEKANRPDSLELHPQRKVRIHLTDLHQLCALAAILLASSNALSQKPAADTKQLPASSDKASAPLQWASNQTAVARTLAERGQLKESERLFREIISLYTEKLGPEHTDTLTSRHGLVVVLRGQGRYAEAEAEGVAVLKLRERILGPEDPETLKTREGLAATLLAQGKISEAEPELQAVHKLRKRLYGPEHPDTLLSRMNLAIVLNKQRNYAEEEAEYRDVLQAS